MKVYFLDTNVFLQCLPLTDLPWGEISGTEDLLLLIPRPVQEEIDRLKQDGNNRRARRARRASAFIREMVMAPESTRTVLAANPRVEISFPSPEAKKRSAPEGLDLSRPDDRIIAAILAYKEEHPEIPVALLTADTNLMLTAKRCGLQFTAIPETWLLPPEADDRDKRIAELERRLKHYEQAQPLIEVSVKDEGVNLATGLAISIRTYGDLTSTQLEKLLVAARMRHPMMTEFRSNVSLGTFMPPIAGLAWKPPGDDDIEKYRHEYSVWETKVQEFFKDYAGRLERPTRRARVTLILENKGSVPAANVIVELEALGGIVFEPPRSKKNEDKPKDPVLPQPPSPPQGQWVHASASSILSAVLDAARLAESSVLDTLRLTEGIAQPALARWVEDFPIPTSPQPKDRNAFYWKPSRPIGHTRRWVFECEEFRHQIHTKPFHLSLFIPRGEATEKGAIVCTVTATNLPEPKRVTIPVRIERVQGNTEDEGLSLIRQW